MHIAIIDKATKGLNRNLSKLKKNSPEILVAVGIIGTVASGVMACLATVKAEKVVDASADRVEGVCEAQESGDITSEEALKEKASIYASTAFDLAKLYAPSVMLGAASITCLVTSHGILKKRNISLMAAYGALDQGYRNYRASVAERFGADFDKEIAYDIKTEEFVEGVFDEETGEPIATSHTSRIAGDPSRFSPYARFFDESCPNWEKNAEYNLMFLQATQKWANDMLQAQGHLTLNEVYERLGIPKTSAGLVVGWVYVDPDMGENKHGDNYVDFGIYRDVEARRDFVNGHECSILLDFNVDGVIYDLI